MKIEVDEFGTIDALIEHKLLSEEASEDPEKVADSLAAFIDEWRRGKWQRRA